ncbi:hypothetical protein [Amycolatopsis sp. MEPSY49]|uniref:hypothetical protein n=1 Tax=Amycolatopsis sp. MEPSY49 TaxID=3151600 RepID=UPI003EF3EF7F
MVPDVLSDDLAVLYLQYSTQWDSFAHHGAVFDLDGTGEPVICYYNGYRADVDVLGDPAGSVPPHAGALGIETMAQTGVQGRGCWSTWNGRSATGASPSGTTCSPRSWRRRT